MQIIGQHIRELRIKKGIGSQELASFLGIPPETLLLIETNRIHATKSQVFSIAAYLGANENDLLRAYQQSRILSEIADDRKLSEVLRMVISAHPYVVRDVSRRHHQMTYDFVQLHSNRSQIKIHKPSFLLDNWIECILYCKDHHLGHSFEKVLPDGMVQLTMELDGVRREVIADHTHSPGFFVKKGWVSGIQTRPVIYGLRESHTTVYVRFRTGGFLTLTGITPAELENGVIEAELLLGSSFLRLRDELLDCHNVQTKKCEDTVSIVRVYLR